MKSKIPGARTYQKGTNGKIHFLVLTCNLTQGTLNNQDKNNRSSTEMRQQTKKIKKLFLKTERQKKFVWSYYTYEK